MQHAVIEAGAPLAVDPRVLMQHPHSTFAALRGPHPVIQLGERQYMALRGADVIALMTDPRTKQIEGPDYVRLNGVPDGITARFLADVFLFDEGDVHRAKRGLFSRTFACRAIRDRHYRIRRVADTIVADLPRGESFDFVERMAARVPARMIAAILGLPTSEVPYVTPRVHAIARAVDPIYPHARHAEIEAATAELFDYVGDHLRARLAAPRGDLLSTLAINWRTTRIIPFESLVYQVLGLIVGGSDTTRAALAVLVALLLEHPEQWAAVKANPGLVPGAVAEALRYEPSVGSITRVTRASLEIGGSALPNGAFIRLSLMSAMRDPDFYAQPERFDIRRSDQPPLHPAFGRGPHRCLGGMLARLELQESLAALIAATPVIELQTPPRMRGFGGIRQVTPMLVVLR